MAVNHAWERADPSGGLSFKDIGNPLGIFAILDALVDQGGLLAALSQSRAISLFMDILLVVIISCVRLAKSRCADGSVAHIDWFSTRAYGRWYAACTGKMEVAHRG